MDMKRKTRTNWEERHFQICLAIISRTETDMYGHTKSLDMDRVVREADSLINILKHRDEWLARRSDSEILN